MMGKLTARWHCRTERLTAGCTKSRMKAPSGISGTCSHLPQSGTFLVYVRHLTIHMLREQHERSCRPISQIGDFARMGARHTRRQHLRHAWVVPPPRTRVRRPRRRRLVLQDGGARPVRPAAIPWRGASSTLSFCFTPINTLCSLSLLQRAPASSGLSTSPCPSPTASSSAGPRACACSASTAWVRTTVVSPLFFSPLVL
jgi:hypothetical protein